MGPHWQEIEENEEIKKEFADYHAGLARYDEDGLVLPPRTVRMIPKYKVSKGGQVLFIDFPV